jgi:hypothetical protein
MINFLSCLKHWYMSNVRIVCGKNILKTATNNRNIGQEVISLRRQERWQQVRQAAYHHQMDSLDRNGLHMAFVLLEKVVFCAMWVNVSPPMTIYLSTIDRRMTIAVLKVASYAVKLSLKRI